MRLLIEGTDSAKVINGWIQKSGYVPAIKKYDYRVKLNIDDTLHNTVVVDGIDCALERKIVTQMELNGVPRFLLQRAGGVRSDKQIEITYPSNLESSVEKGVYQGLLQEIGNYEYRQKRRKPKVAVAVVTTLLLLLLASISSAQSPNFPIVRFWDGVAIVNAGDSTNNAIRTNCVEGCTNSDDTVATGALGALNATVTVALAGKAGAGLHIDAGTLTGTLSFQLSIDNGVSWFQTGAVDMPVGNRIGSVALTNPNAADNFSIITINGVTHARVLLNPYTSGTLNATVVATNNTDAFVLALSAQPNGQPQSTISTAIGGTDGTTHRSINVENATPSSTDYGAVVRQVPEGTATATNDGQCLTLTTTTAVISASNATRRAFYLYARGTNTDDVFLKLGGTATTSDFPLAAGQSFNMDKFMYTGTIDGRSNTGNQDVCWVEL